MGAPVLPVAVGPGRRSVQTIGTTPATIETVTVDAALTLYEA